MGNDRQERKNLKKTFKRLKLILEKEQIIMLAAINENFYNAMCQEREREHIFIITPLLKKKPLRF